MVVTWWIVAFFCIFHLQEILFAFDHFGVKLDMLQ